MAWTLIIRSVLIIVKKRSHYYKEKNHESNFGFSKSSNMSSSSRDSSMISFRFLSSSIQKIELYATRICCIKYRRVYVWYVRDSGLIIFQYWLILFFFLLLHVPTLSIYSSFGGHSQITVLGERVEKAPRTEFVVEPLVVIVRCAIYFIMQNSKY